MKVSSLKYLLTLLGFVACLALTTGCNKGYGCPADFHADNTTEVSDIPAC